MKNLIFVSAAIAITGTAAMASCPPGTTAHVLTGQCFANESYGTSLTPNSAINQDGDSKLLYGTPRATTPSVQTDPVQVPVPVFPSVPNSSGGTSMSQ